MKRRHTTIQYEATTHFVTTTVVGWIPVFSIPEIAEYALSSFEHYRSRTQLMCLGFVLMPDHFHAVLHQPVEGEVAEIMMNFKKATSAFIQRQLAGQAEGAEWLDTFRKVGASLHPQRPRVQVWMDRYDDVLLPTQKAVVVRLDYTHGNPDRRELVEYPYSSRRDYEGQPNPWVTVDTGFVGMYSV